MRRITYLLLSVILLAILTFAGYQLLQTLSTPTPQPTATPTSGTTAPLGQGILNLSSINPTTLDPAVSREASSHEYIMQIFSGLARLDDNLEPVPDIAERWQVSSDGKTYTFYLRHGVKFQNGRELKAADFKYSWERACTPATGSQTAVTYLGDIVGAKEMLAGRSTELSGVKVVDDYTLTVTIDAPKTYFLSKVAYPTFYVVDKDNVASGKDWWRKPNGTGPFKLSQWVENQSVVLDRNELFYGQTAQLKQVVYQLYSGYPMDLYETGKIDIAGVSLDYIDKVTDKSGTFYKELTIVPELSFYYLGFNCQKPPFDDVNIRRAFALAVDKDKLVSLIFRDMVGRADGILPPGMPGFNKNLAGLGYDVNKARELIKASKYGDVSKLPPIMFTVAGSGGSAGKLLEAVIYQWRQNLGVDVQVRQLQPEQYIYVLKSELDEMFDMGWIADYPHPQDFLDILFHSGAEDNFGGYSNPEIDALLDKANIEQNREQSLAMYQQIEQKMVQDVAAIPIYFGKNYTLVKPYVKGYKPNPMGYVMLNKVSVQR